MSIYIRKNSFENDVSKEVFRPLLKVPGTPYLIGFTPFYGTRANKYF